MRAEDGSGVFTRSGERNAQRRTAEYDAGDAALELEIAILQHVQIQAKIRSVVPCGSRSQRQNGPLGTNGGATSRYWTLPRLPTAHAA
jgi:hypothetical protein